MEFETLQALTDIGYPLLLLILVALGTKKLWSDVWSWWTGTFWPGREVRWEQQTHATAERDIEYRRLAESFIGAMKDYQDGFQTRNQSEHERIIAEMGVMCDTTVSQMELIVAEVRQWNEQVASVITIIYEERKSRED